VIAKIDSGCIVPINVGPLLRCSLTHEALSISNPTTDEASRTSNSYNS